MVQNRRIVLNERPVVAPIESTFRIDSREIDLSEKSLSEGEILVKTQLVSLDPYLRMPLGSVGDVARPSPFNINHFKDAGSIAEIGALLGGKCVGKVLFSKNAKIATGSLVAADWKWEEYAIFNPDTEPTFEKVDTKIFAEQNEAGKIPASVILGHLGVSGSHAYFGYHEGLHPKSGETLVISSAAGCIGTVVGQLGKHDGLRVIGITSGAKAQRLVDDKIVDAALDYKSVGSGDTASLSKKLKELCPQGIDLYYDNARGFISEAVLENLNPGARVYICGAASTYNDKEQRGKTYENVPNKDGVQFTTGKQVGPKYLKEVPHARAELVTLARAGHLKFPQETYEGFENIPKAFLGMLEGKNYGKMIVKL